MSVQKAGTNVATMLHYMEAILQRPLEQPTP